MVNDDFTSASSKHWDKSPQLLSRLHVSCKECSVLPPVLKIEMPLIMKTFGFGSKVLVLITICTLFKFSKGQVETSPSISSSVGNYVCQQQSEFQESGTIQPPLKSRPENDESKCGWLLWTKCSEGNSESCPAFELQACDELEPEKAKKKGKGIATSGQQQQEIGPRRDQCDSSPEQGLPNPQIVPSLSKYPSVVTIERGDGCLVKYCTGLILNENWIIVQQTGCFYLYQKDHSDFYVIVAGEGKMHVDEGTEQRRSVAEYIRHPGLNMEETPEGSVVSYYKDNIGVVRVSTPFEFNENVQPIDLSAIEAIAPSIPSSLLTIVGWLKTQPMKEEDELLSSLIESPLDFVPFDQCYDGFMEADGVANDTDDLFCAGKCVVYGDESRQPRRNVLYAQETPESPPVPVGIGPVRTNVLKPKHGVFVNLAAYIPWIKETTEGQGQGQTPEISEPESESDSRIIRGEDAPPYKYKSMVSLQKYRSYACTFPSCGASILNEEWILTAAHCVDKEEPKDLRVVAGEYDISVDDENEQIVTVSQIIKHEDWDPKGNLNDIAVLKVTPPIKFNDKIQKVALPEASMEVTGPLTAIGWGTTENDFINLHNLQQVQLPFVPLEECKPFYANFSSHPGEGNVCAGNETHTVCIGDSGGPIYQIGESEEQIIVGLVSYGESDLCTVRNKTRLDPDPRRRRRRDVGLLGVPWRPAVFTKVAYYLEWIMKNTEMS